MCFSVTWQCDSWTKEFHSVRHLAGRNNYKTNPSIITYIIHRHFRYFRDGWWITWWTRVFCVLHTCINEAKWRHPHKWIFSQIAQFKKMFLTPKKLILLLLYYVCIQQGITSYGPCSLLLWNEILGDGYCWLEIQNAMQPSRWDVHCILSQLYSLHLYERRVHFQSRTDTVIKCYSR